MSFEVTIDHSTSHPIIVLKDLQTETSAEIYSFGGLLNAFNILKDGQLINIVAGFDSIDDARNEITNGFKSAKLSPFVCRMAEGKFEWNEDQWQVEKWFLGKHAIHGLLYDAVYQIQSSRADANSASVELYYSYPGNEKGYPYPYMIQLLWKLEKTINSALLHLLSILVRLRFLFQMDGILILVWGILLMIINYNLTVYNRLLLMQNSSLLASSLKTIDSRTVIV